ESADAQFEHYLDFPRNRTFRRTLLFHGGMPLRRDWSAGSMAGLLLSSRAEVMENPGPLASPEIAKFRSQRGSVLSASHPLVKAALVCLAARRGEPLEFAAFVAEIGRQLERPAALSEEDQRGLTESLIVVWLGGFIELHAWRGRAAAVAGERPVASPLARLQATSGRRVASLRHRVIQLEDPDRRLLALLDGSRDRAAIA